MKRGRSSRPARRLRVSIEALPPATTRAMLEGVRSGPIIAGAYTSSEGTCPMLAAHRRGGRTSLDTFARAWDGYTQATSARLATERELRTLESMLEVSLGEEGVPPSAGDLGRAITEHREAREREATARAETEAAAQVEADAARSASPGRRPDSARPGDLDRAQELRGRPGWAWLRVFRRLDDYEAALAQALENDAGERAESLVGADN